FTKQTVYRGSGHGFCSISTAPGDRKDGQGFSAGSFRHGESSNRRRCLMRRVLFTAGRGLGVFLGGLLVSPLMAQGPLPAPTPYYPVQSRVTVPAEARQRGDVLRMDVYSGPTRRARFFSTNLSPGEMAAVRDLERAENDVAYADDLLSLRQIYADSERIL